MRALAAKARVWCDTQSRFDEGASPGHGQLGRTSSFPRTRLQTRLQLAVSLLPLLRPCSTAPSPRPFGQKPSTAQPELTGFYGPAHDAIVDQFRELETWRRRATVETVLGQHAEKMPRGNYGAMNTIRSEIARRRGHMAIRKLFRTAGETLQRIKPVLLLISPISVAQFLPPSSVEFDLLVIDEASQVRPEEAFGLVGASADGRRRGQ